MPLGLHFIANFMQGTVPGFRVSGDKDPHLLKHVFDISPVWLNGGAFGIDASIRGLFSVTLITISLFYWYPSRDKATIGQQTPQLF